MAVAASLLLFCVAGAAQAQAVDPNAGKITFTAGIDAVNAYMFRGLRQDDTRVILWPFADAAVDLYSGAGGVRNVALHIGTWNSLHTGAAGYAGPSGKLWYESDVYGTLSFGLANDIGVASTYTAYTSPNNTFTTVKELAVKVTAGQQRGVGGVALNPYALVAFEFDTSPGVGQADGGLERGTYLELGVAPAWASSGLNLTFPIKVGLSLDDYYELAGVDHTFGYLSLGAIATVPLGGSTDYGSWNVHGGFEFQSLGDTPEAFNGGDQSKIIGLVGIGFTY